jgi:uncharacterized repeat protein (TIGR01451 family)
MIPRLAMLIALLLILFFGSSKLATIGWANSTTVSIDPDPQGVILGDTATTDVRVENVDDLYGFEFEITFNPAFVEAVQIQPGTFLSPDWILENTIDNDSGTINYALCQRYPHQPKDGDGVLATITWRGKALGTSSIHFTYVKLGAPGPVPIPSTTQDGQITVGMVDLELTKDVDNANPTQGQQVMFTITVTNKGPLDATGVKVEEVAWPAKLRYDEHSGGTYDSGTRIWDIGDLAVSASATLYITATVMEDGYFENVAEVYACNEPDKDSTPNNYPIKIEDDTGAVSGEAIPTAITLSSFAARSSTGLETSLVWPWLVGVAALVTSGVLWIKRRR